MSTEALEATLRALGVHGTVSAEGAVAVVRVAGEDRALERPEVRKAALAAAADHGFRGLALEVAD